MVIDDNNAAATGLLKDDSVYPEENDEDEHYTYDKECEEEYNPDNVDVFQLFQNNMGTKCSPTEFIHSSGINRGADVIPVANGNAILQDNDNTCVKHADGTLYNFNMISGATYEIPPAINTTIRVIDYVDSYFEFYECTDHAPAIDPFEKFLDTEGSIFPFAILNENPSPACTEDLLKEFINDPSPFHARSPTSALRYLDKASLPMPFLSSIISTAIAVTLVGGLPAFFDVVVICCVDDEIVYGLISDFVGVERFLLCVIKSLILQ